jgi:hypothetical protein
VCEGEDSQFTQEASRDGAEGNSRCRFACRGALEYVPGVVESVLLHSGEVGVAGARTRERSSSTGFREINVDRLWAHDVDPFRPFGVANSQSDGAPHAQAVAHPTGNRYCVFLEFHSRTTPITQPTAG